MRLRSPYQKSAIIKPSRSKWDPATCHPATKPVPREFLKNEPTRQRARWVARRLEYNRLGVGLGMRPVFDLPRKVLRAIARDIVKRQWKERHNAQSKRS